VFKSIAQLFDDRWEKTEMLAANVFVQLVRQCPPTTAARAAFDYAESFMSELDKRKKRHEQRNKND
jgi:hypothetical protein